MIRISLLLISILTLAACQPTPPLTPEERNAKAFEAAIEAGIDTEAVFRQSVHKAMSICLVAGATQSVPPPIFMASEGYVGRSGRLRAQGAYRYFERDPQGRNGNVSRNVSITFYTREPKCEVTVPKQSNTLWLAIFGASGMEANGYRIVQIDQEPKTAFRRDKHTVSVIGTRTNTGLNLITLRTLP